MENVQYFTSRLGQRIVLSHSNVTDSIAFWDGHGKEALRITPDGELIFANASDAASALLNAWNRLRGSIVGAPAVEE